MMIKRLLSFALLLLCVNLFGQDNGEIPEKDPIWATGGSIGLDLSQMLLINPKIGAGENRFAIGGLNTLFAKYNKGKTIWENDANLQLAIQRLGSSDNPFTKNIDVLRLNSKYGYKLNGNLNVALLFTFESLMLNTYDDLALSSTGSNTLSAKFLSPATVLLAPGIDYVKNEKLSVFMAPFAYKSILVLDDELAGLGVHGNPWTSEDDFENIKHELGANLKVKYIDSFKEVFKYSGELNLFYDYLAKEHGVEFLDVIFINDFGVELFKGFTLNLLVDLRWDRDIASVLGEGIEPDGLEEFRKWMITETFVVKYNYTF